MKKREKTVLHLVFMDLEKKKTYENVPRVIDKYEDARIEDRTCLGV